MDDNRKYDLICRYDSRKSFYGKAKTFLEDNKLKLQSYNTIVAEKDMSGKNVIFRCFGRYSQTTTRHQKEFFKQLGLTDKQIKEVFDKGELEV